MERANIAIALKQPPSSVAFEDMYSLGPVLGQGTFGIVYACTPGTGSKLSPVPSVDERESDLCVKICPLNSTLTARKAGTSKVSSPATTATPSRSSSLLSLPCSLSSSPSSSSSDVLVESSSDDDNSLGEAGLKEVLLRLRHPNLVQYHAFLLDADQSYIVMQRCLGTNLARHLRDAGGHLPAHRVHSLAPQLFRGVQAVHDAGLMHRDLKPGNFSFSDDSNTTLQLLDFGCAKFASDVPRQHSVVGTMIYAAPEVFDGVYSRIADIWSLGVVLYEMFTGHPPFQTRDERILRSLHRDPVLRGDGIFYCGEGWKVPQEARPLVRSLLEQDPTSRPRAGAAAEHAWFQMSVEDIEEPVSPLLLRQQQRLLGRETELCKSALTGSSAQVGGLKRSSGQGLGGLSGLGLSKGLKSSAPVWDLAAMAASDCECE